MNTQKNSNKKHENSKEEFLSTAELLTKQLKERQQYYNVLCSSHILQKDDANINPEKIQEKFRLLQNDLRSLSQKFGKAQKSSKYFPGISHKFFSGERICGVLISEIYDYLPIPL